MNHTQEEITTLVGEQTLAIAFLARELKKAQAKVAELEKKNGNPDADKRADAA